MTLASRLLLLVALALTPPLVFGIVNDVVQRNERTAALNQSALAEGRSAQDSLFLIIDGVHRLLAAMAEAPPLRSDDAAACTRYLQAVTGQLHEYSLLASVDQEGLVRCNNLGSSANSYSVADRAYYRRVLQTGRFSSGDLVIGINTRRPSLHFALPFRTAEGVPDGMVVASVDQDWLAEQLAAETVPPGAEIILIDAGGVVVAAARDGMKLDADWVGRPAPAALLDGLAVSEPKVLDMPGPDGAVRLFGALPANPALLGIRVVVGVDRARAFNDLWAASLRNLFGLGLGGIIALLVGILGARRLVLGPLARIAAVADRVGTGDLRARADLGPQAGGLNELGAGFDRMIAALEARQTEREQAEAALRREEARLRFALEAGGLGSFEWNLRTNDVYFSDTVQQMFGFGPGEGNRVADFTARVVPEDREQAAAESRAGIAAGRLVHTFRIMRDGKQRFILSQGETVTDKSGTPFLIGLLSDETERLTTISALRESEARFQAIVNCIDQMVWSTRADGHHDYFNQRWYEFTGTQPGATDGSSWLGVFHPDDAEETNRIWQDSLATGRPYHREYRLRHVSGAFRWVLGRAQAIHDENGTIIRWYGTCTDIDDIVRAREVLARSREVLTRQVADRTAELVAAEDQLRQSQKMEAVGQLTGGIAHDFNNMLQAIGGALELLVRRVEQNKLEDAKRFAGIARTTVDRAASLTHRLLAFARRQTLSPEPVDPVELLNSMSELVSRTVGATIEVSTVHDRAHDGAHDGAPEGDGWLVLCDRNQLENVVFNLCINARDAMPNGGKLLVSSRHAVLGPADVTTEEGADVGEYVELVVSDNGAGMDEATRARAFEPFFTTKPLGQGTGLGLSQVYGFVRQSGGFVRLQSSPGVGTTVQLFMPRHIPAAPDAVDDGPALNALVVESDAAVRASIADELQALGFTVGESDGSGDVMRLITGTPLPVQLLVTQVGLPGNLNGRQVAEAARSRWPALPVLFITGFAGSLQDGELGTGMAVAATPIDPAELRERIHELMDG